MMRLRPRVVVASLSLLTLAGCATPTVIGGAPTATPANIGTKLPTRGTPTVGAGGTPTTQDICPAAGNPSTYCYTPHSLQVAYHLDSLIKQGLTGKGQTVVDIVSYGNPTIQQDMDVYSKQFGLPSVQVQVIAPLGTTPTDNPSASDRSGWAGETQGDVEMIHAIAPDAKIVVLTSPVAETEGAVGFPEFLKLEQYAVDHQLGSIVSQSFGASEYSLQNDPAGPAIVQQFASFYQTATTQKGITFLASSGDGGATDVADATSSKLVPHRTSSFPNDVPWVTSVGGTTLHANSATLAESGWDRSGGGTSALFTEPDYQKGLPSANQSILNGQRGLPDIAAVADPYTAPMFYVGGQWIQIGGTSMSAPLWAGVVAIANQVAGHSLGFINPALYKLGEGSTYAQDFRDITVGNNSVNTGSVTVQGFDAVAGWDACTGWGAPLGDHLVQDLVAASQPAS